ncbi:MAG TPA: DinB family protein [Hanamia sp.]|nr:DinB family protein [Hanamia sp.]
MKTTSKKVTMETFVEVYDYHTKMFINALDGLSDKDAQNRLGTKANHIAWIAGSLVYQRQFLANAVGIDVKQTSEKLFENNQGIHDNITYPPLEEYREDWEKISPLLKDALANMSEEELNGPDPYKMPGGNFTFFDTAVVFSIDRESYCLGQIGLYRRLLGYEAMKYPE